MSRTELSAEEKLEALSLRFYQGLEWHPKAGDYYTTSRNDRELYQVVDVSDGVVRTRYTAGSDTLSEWPVSEFQTESFGPKRVWVPDFVLKN